ncbi:non-ribosomal peptide synthase domain TIGR01720/amino acid adenylation domain-containing protein [Stigmatella aurantiaca]|uniref:Non-ribosomal peptide synthase domain TIGR01720/amino acid adenylation domain-containing protein n=1 Tax=Stigmatella aurantiaca TaxID=41 RepID=A0A1H8AGB1_STIAU|nr:non-ribosomal peptide synthetase [Stigmatella aurantiaca]SEM69546.1 non-ribosomal peptide synthase domain TIGR01720/amino acid adenylation domain-containing protein [Stigmatella aurantiaca]
MTVLELVTGLRQRGVRLWLEQDQLRCSAPKGVLTEELRASLSAHKSELIDFLREAQAASPTHALITRAPRPPRIPLSFAQQRLWFLDRLEPDSPLYNMTAPLRLRGPLDVEAFRRACTEVVRRHESLRTTFQMAEDQPFQVIAPPAPHPVPLVSLEAHPPGGREAIALRMAREESSRPFDLTRGPLVRTILLRLAPDDHVLLLTLHHIVSDGWSETVLVREVAALYTAVPGTGPALPELPIQYADFALWQRSWLQGEVLERQLAYWRRQLAGAPQVLELPSDRPRPAAWSGGGASLWSLIPAELAEALRASARREGATLFMMLMAAFQALLHRYTGQDDIVVGTDVANRSRAETQGLIGFFVNQLALRARFEGNLTFRELLGQVRATALDAYAHQDLPFEELVKVLNPERSRGHASIFQVKLLLQDVALSELSLPGLTIQPVEVEQSSAKLDLTVFVAETPRGLECKWEYSTELFEEGTIRRMVAHYQRLLAGAVAAPGCRVSALPLLSTDEEHQLLAGWNDTQTEYPHAACVHALFEEQARRTPESLAVLHEGFALRYRELNERANQLARRLQAMGVGPETVVGLCLDRSPELVVGLFGILKAGAAYLPLDPTYPAERLGFMLQDARVPVLVTLERIADELPSQGEQLICLDSDQASLAREETSNLELPVTAGNLAYVLYTSGSTGKPKGTMIEHRGVVNYLSWCTGAYRVAEGSGAPVHSSISFDLTVTSLLAPLVAGRTVTLVPEDNRLEGLAKALRSTPDFSLVKLTPTHLRLIARQLDAAALAGQARALVIGGETLTAEALEPWRNHAPGTRLINEYGPTETVVGCCVHEARPGDARTGSIPIGRPIANTRLYVLDEHLRLVPVGVPGELYIGGAGVARGYLDRPELTAERFVPDPFGGVPGARLYRTGDRVRRFPDGVLDFLGRRDEQVKVRGYRIELGEIEAVLGQAPGVREVVAAAREDIEGSKRLVAYVVPDEGAGMDPEVLRQLARAKLPEHMVPSVVVPLDALPLSPNGKVDRRALPAPEALAREARHTYVAPRTSTQALLCSLGAEVLRLERVGIRDNFFDLGGDSILGVQLIGRANRAGLNLTPKQLFDHQTFEELAAVAGTGGAITAEQGLVKGDVPLTPIQLWFFRQPQPAPHHFNQAVLLETHALFRPDLLEPAIQALLAHHDALRLRFEETGHGWTQHCVEMERAPAVSMFDLSGLPPERQRRELEATAARLQESLDLQQGPLLRAAWFDLGHGNPGRLLLFAHHLAVDGFSWRVLLEDLQAAHQELLQGRELLLPAKTTSYQHWSRRLREYAASSAPAFDYWRRQDRSNVARLPEDVPGDSAPSDTAADARTYSVELGAEETSALLREVLETFRCGMNDVLLTALASVLAHWTGGRRWLVDMEGHGREPLFDDVDLSRTVGWFTSIFPAVLEASANDGLLELLESVKAQLQRIPNQGIDFGVLRYLRQDDAGGAPADEAQVLFNYLGQFDQVFAGDGLFQPAEESPGPTVSPLAPRTHALEVNGLIHGGRLRIGWTYSEARHRAATIAQLAERFLQVLRELVALARAGGHRGRAASFPLARLAPMALERLLADAPGTEDVYPLVLGQREMFKHTRAHPGAWAYFTQLSCRVVGPFSPDAFVAACQRVMERHPALRSSVALEAMPEPHQLVHREPVLPVERLDWTERTDSDVRATLEQLLEADRETSFSPDRPPLLRLTFIQLAPQAFHLVWSSHHGMLDGWSMSLLLEEVFTVYGAISRGAPVELPPRPPFRELVVWLQRQQPWRAEAYWRRELADLTGPPVASRSPAGGQRFLEHERYAERTIEMAPTTTEALQELARAHRLTLNTLIQGAWALVLANDHRTQEVVFGVTAAVRPVDIPGVEDMVGHLINTLPARVRLVPGAPVLEWLAQLQAQQVEQRQFGHVPLSTVRRWTGLPDDSPLFDSVLRFENYPIRFVLERAAPGFTVEAMRIIDRWPYPLSLVAVPGPPLRLELGWQRDRIDEDTATRALEQMQYVLERLLGDPGQTLSALVEGLQGQTLPASGSLGPSATARTSPGAG